MAAIAAEQDALAAEGIGVVAISTESQSDSAAFAEKIGARFPLLADPDASIAAAYGVKMKGETLAVPASFVVRRDGTIAWRYIGEGKPDRPALDVVRAQARSVTP